MNNHNINIPEMVDYCTVYKHGYGCEWWLNGSGYPTLQKVRILPSRETRRGSDFLENLHPDSTRKKTRPVTNYDVCTDPEPARNKNRIPIQTFLRTGSRYHRNYPIGSVTLVSEILLVKTCSLFSHFLCWRLPGPGCSEWRGQTVRYRN